MQPALHFFINSHCRYKTAHVGQLSANVMNRQTGEGEILQSLLFRIGLSSGISAVEGNGLAPILLIAYKISAKICSFCNWLTNVFSGAVLNSRLL